MTVLRTSAEWAEQYRLRITDPDGWREASAPAFDTDRITYDEFDRRAVISTVELLPGYPNRAGSAS